MSSHVFESAGDEIPDCEESTGEALDQLFQRVREHALAAKAAR